MCLNSVFLYTDMQHSSDYHWVYSLIRLLVSVIIYLLAKLIYSTRWLLSFLLDIPVTLRWTWCRSTSGVRTFWCVVFTWRMCRHRRHAHWLSSTCSAGLRTASPAPHDPCWTSAGIARTRMDWLPCMCTQTDLLTHKCILLWWTGKLVKVDPCFFFSRPPYFGSCCSVVEALQNTFSLYCLCSWDYSCFFAPLLLHHSVSLFLANGGWWAPDRCTSPSVIFVVCS